MGLLSSFSENVIIMSGNGSKIEVLHSIPIKIIAERLSISDRTVEKHRSSMMVKTNSNNMIEVIIYALRNNLIEI